MPRGRLQRLARRGEERTAQKLGGRRQPASGSKPWAKADIKSEHVLVEEKLTTLKSYSLRLSDLDTLRRQAALEDRVPVFKIVFDSRAVAVIDWQLFMELQARYFDRE